MDAYLDIPNNYYIPDGKNSRLLDLVERREFKRKTIDGNERFVLQIPFLEQAFGTKYFVVDKQNSSMMGIFDNKVETISAEAQMKPFNLAQLSHMIATIEQCRQGFNESSVAGLVAGHAEAPNNDRLHYPSTPKEFETSDFLKQLQYDSNMLTPKERSGLCWDHTKVIVEMADTYNVFSRCMYFNPEMSDKYQSNIEQYTRYYSDLIRCIDIFLQEDQLMHTKLGFPLVSVPYVPNMHELECSDVRKIEDTAFAEARQVENEMLVIMEELQENQEQHDISSASFHSSFSRIRSDGLSDMGYGLSKISPITFERDVFQTPKNQTQDTPLPSTPRKKRNEIINKTFPVNQVLRQQEQPRSKSYDAELSVTDEGAAKLFGRFIPPCPTNADNFAAGSSEDSQNFNQTTVFNGKSTGTDQPRNTGMQTSPSEPVPAGITGVMHSSPRKVSQTGGTQTIPPLSPKRSTSTGETQTTPA